jgi:hypothetical protein
MASSAWRSSHCASECICPKWSSHKVRIGTQIHPRGGEIKVLFHSFFSPVLW